MLNIINDRVLVLLFYNSKVSLYHSILLIFQLVCFLSNTMVTLEHLMLSGMISNRLINIKLVMSELMMVVPLHT